jgi:hypothetical protein
VRAKNYLAPRTLGAAIYERILLSSELFLFALLSCNHSLPVQGRIALKEAFPYNLFHLLSFFFYLKKTLYCFALKY